MLRFPHLRGQPLLAAALLALAPALAGAQSYRNDGNIHGVVGLGVATIPSYPGADEQRTIPLPVANLRFSDNPFYIGNLYGGSPLQAGVHGSPLQGVEAGIGLSTQFVQARKNDDWLRRAGVDEIDREQFATGFIDWSHGGLHIGGWFEHALGDGEQGDTLTLRLQRRVLLGRATRLDIGPSATWADRDHMRTFFGVPGTGDLPAYAPAGGLLDLSMDAHLTQALSPNWLLSAGLRVSRLQSRASDSPLVLDQTPVSASIALLRRF